jgi:hypothetical protein
MDIAEVIANLGFPIGLAIYLLTRFEKKMDGLETSITGKDGIVDKLEDIKIAIKVNNKAVKRNYVGKIKVE